MISSAIQAHNVLLIGAGPHAQKVYLPWIQRHGHLLGVNLAGIIELEDKISSTSTYLDQLGLRTQLLGSPDFRTAKLPSSLTRKLNRFIQESSIDSVIIATEPSVHKPYAVWALENGLHVLMDKPITARMDSRTQPRAAKLLIKDYEELVETYDEARQKYPGLLFSICSQRRHHVGFQRVEIYIKDVLDKTNCPITSIQSSHADGQWRLPHELADMEYHGFTRGYGKVSHSGYHFFDLINRLITIGTPREKTPDTVDVFSTLITPVDHLKQLTIDDYKRLFSAYDHDLKQNETEKLVANFGEIDAYSLMNFKQSNNIICTAQLSLQHNSFSRRSWPISKLDLYKGNGRVKHEHHVIQQGPFQSIQIHSYQQSAYSHGSSDYDVGGRNHFDIYVFRNSDITGGRPLERISIDEVLENPLNLDLLTEVIKSSVIEEFFSYLNGKVARQEVRSDLNTHKNSVNLMASVYLSNILRMKRKASPYTMPWRV